MTIGEKILNLRKERNFSQEDLAEKIDVTRQTISNWETDNTVPDFYQTISLCRALNIGISEFAKEWIDDEKKIDLSVEDEIYEKVLAEIKKEVSSLAFDTWFKDTKLIKLHDNDVIIKVSLPIQKRHLNSNYKEIIINKLKKVTSKNYKDILFVDKTESNY